MTIVKMQLDRLDFFAVYGPGAEANPCCTLRKRQDYQGTLCGVTEVYKMVQAKLLGPTRIAHRDLARDPDQGLGSYRQAGEVICNSPTSMCEQQCCCIIIHKSRMASARLRKTFNYLKDDSEDDLPEALDEEGL